MSNVITGNKILAHLDRVLKDQKPITADVFLNNYCNNNCPYCAYRRWELDDGARYMRFDDFVKYANRMRELGVLGIILSGGGEPSIAKDFDSIVRWLDANEIHWGINTNFNRYFIGNPEYVKVSLDAWDEDSYKASRGVNAYGIVRENIVKFADAKSDRTKLGIQLVAKSAEAVYKFYEANNDLPVDYITIRPVESTNGIHYRGDTQTPQEIVNAIQQIRDLDDRVILNYKWEMLRTSQNTCTAQWAQIAVNEVGEVMYCCHKPYQIVGHIMDEDIMEKKRQSMTDMLMCDIPCRLTAPNYEVARITATQMNAEFI